MSGFLARWSRRKAASRAAPGEPSDTNDASPPDLPPLESLGAESDYTVFLARGVSHVVQAQALRVAWASDPVIANFRGMAEYAWDFNAPGYGELAPGDDAVEWLSQIVRSGAKLAAASAQPISATPACSDVAPPALAAPVEPLAALELPKPEEPTAEVPSPVPGLRRRHGSAVPV